MKITNIEQLINQINSTWYPVELLLSKRNVLVGTLNNLEYKNFLKVKQSMDEESETYETDMIELICVTLMNKVKDARTNELINLKELEFVDYLYIMLHVKAYSSDSVTTNFTFKCKKEECTGKFQHSFCADDLKLDIDSKFDYSVVFESESIIGENPDYKNVVFYLKHQTVKNVVDAYYLPEDEYSAFYIEGVALVTQDDVESDLGNNIDTDYKLKLVQNLKIRDRKLLADTEIKYPSLEWVQEVNCSEPKCTEKHKVVIINNDFSSFFV